MELHRVFSRSERSSSTSKKPRPTSFLQRSNSTPGRLQYPAKRKQQQQTSNPTTQMAAISPESGDDAFTDHLLNTLSQGRILTSHTQPFTNYLDTLRATSAFSTPAVSPTPSPSHQDPDCYFSTQAYAACSPIPRYKFVPLDDGSSTSSVFAPTSLSQLRGLLDSYRPANPQQLSRLYRKFLEEAGLLDDMCRKKKGKSGKWWLKAALGKLSGSKAEKEEKAAAGKVKNNKGKIVFKPEEDAREAERKELDKSHRISMLYGCETPASPGELPPVDTKGLLSASVSCTSLISIQIDEPVEERVEALPSATLEVPSAEKARMTAEEIRRRRQSWRRSSDMCDIMAKIPEEER